MTDHDRPPGPEGGPIAEAIARVRELDEAATPGPWDSEYDGNGYHINGGGVFVGDHYEGYREDAALISTYRTAAPLLAAECERLRERVARLEAENDSRRAELRELKSDLEGNERMREALLDLVAWSEECSGKRSGMGSQLHAWPTIPKFAAQLLGKVSRAALKGSGHE